MKSASRLAGASVAAFLVSLQAAQAHIVASRLGDFYAGALHPASDLQDVLLWLAIGLLAGSLGAGKAKWIVLIVPIGLLAGVALAQTFGFSSPRPVAASVLILALGLLLAADFRVPTAPFLAGVFCVAALRGAANVSEIAPDANLLLYASGLAVAGYVVVTLLAAATFAFRGASGGHATHWRNIAVRALGSWLAAIGLMTGGLSLAS